MNYQFPNYLYRMNQEEATISYSDIVFSYFLNSNTVSALKEHITTNADEIRETRLENGLKNRE